MKRTTALALVVALAGCGGTERRAERPFPPVPKESAKAPLAESGSRDDRAAEQAVAETLAWVGTIRELSPKAPVRARVLSRGEMAEAVRAQTEREVPPDMIRAESEILVALGLAPVTFDFVQSLTNLMGEELAGFYEPEQNTMFLARDLSGSEWRATLAHELVHALQDQHFGLDRLMGHGQDEPSDRLDAIHALAEGDAMSAMIDAMLGPGGGHATDLPDELLALQVRGAAAFVGSADAPPVLVRALLAPYVDGLAFVHALRRRGGWASVDAAWRSPPVSTAQLLHPEKFFAHAMPVPVGPLGAPRGGPSATLYSDVFGEESLRIIFEEWVPRRTAVDAAGGWAGDRVAVFADPARVAVAWHIRFSDEPAAGRAFVAFARGVLRPEPEAGGEPTSARDPIATEAEAAEAARGAKVGKLCVDRSARGPFSVVRRGAHVVVTAGPFSRNSGGVRADGSCASALEWAIDLAARD